jgi:hypothetical protein
MLEMGPNLAVSQARYVTIVAAVPTWNVKFVSDYDFLLQLTERI